MRFLGDMGISLTTIAWLRNEGHDASHLRDEGLQRIPDKEIVSKARAENRIILTFDLDFGAILACSGDQFPIVIIFRISNAKPENVNSRLTKVLSASSAVLEKGAILSVEDDIFRVRILPIPH